MTVWAVRTGGVEGGLVVGERALGVRPDQWWSGWTVRLREAGARRGRDPGWGGVYDVQWWGRTDAMVGDGRSERRAGRRRSG